LPAGTLALVVQDFTGDGWPEIAITPSRSYANQKVFILTNPANGSVNFTSISPITINGSANLNDMATADFNGDGRIDFVFADRANDKGLVWLNLGNLAFASVNGTTGFAASEAWGVDVADMNGDGFADFVIGCRDFAVPQVNVFISDGAATPTFAKTSVTSPKGNWFVKAADYDGDSKPDIATTSTNNSSSFSIDIWKNRMCHQPVILNSNPITICSGQTITLQAVALQGVSYSWSKGTNTGATSDITFADVGNVTLTATGEGGTCTPTANITVNSGAGTAPSKPTITQPAGVCGGASITLQTATVTGATYLWSGPNNYTASTNTPSSLVTNSATSVHKGDYFLSVKVGDCTSTSSDAKFVDVISASSFTIAGNTVVCTGQPLSLSVSNSADYNYQWKLNGTNISGETEATFPKTPRNAVVGDEGSYTVFVSHKVFTSCTSETSPLSLNVLTAPVASFNTSPSQICVGTEVTFDATGATVDNSATINYAWTFGDGGSEPNGATSSTTHTYNATQTGISAALTISYTGVTGCSSSSSTSPFNVSDATQPTIETTPASVTEICSDGSETVTLTVTQTFDSYTWSTSQTGQSITVNQPGVYSVETVNSGGCIGNDEIELVEKPGCGGGDINIQVPKAFTPNEDNFNDTWKIVGIETMNQNCEMNLFDGRGRRVLTMKVASFPVTGWDGTSGGTEVPAGTYYYVFGCPTGKPVTGTVLIVR
jgi:gliding motility-associated-like protein